MVVWAIVLLKLVMSVYTRVSPHEIEEFLCRYDNGHLLDYHGINEGIENTIYFVHTDANNNNVSASNRYVLILFEWQDQTDLPYFIKLMLHLASANLPCPQPVADKQGHHLQTLCNKPAILTSWLAGQSIDSPDENHCTQIGSMLATLHATVENFTQKHPDKRGFYWREQCAKKILPLLTHNDASLLNNEINRHKAKTYNVPQGTIHADLFRDNVLFHKGHLSGVLDFYYACEGHLIYDLAVAVNDWCSNEDGSINESNYSALVGAYAKHRPFLPEEKDIWQTTLCRAAIRFWLSRLHDTYFPRDGQITHVKNADVFKNILLHRRREILPLC